MVINTFTIGIVSVISSAIFNGSVFVPMKFVDATKGLFPQFMMGLGILFIGAIVCVIEGFPPIYSVVTLGGIFWAAGNAFCVPIMNVLGMALGILIWSTTSAMMGWSVARFGLFGIKSTPPSNSYMNYGGLVLLILGGVTYLFVKSVPYSSKNKNIDEPTIMSFTTESKNFTLLNHKLGESEKANLDMERTANVKSKIIAVVAALLNGLLFGVMSTPITYITDRKEKYGNPPDRGTYYTFSHFLGFFLTSAVIFLGYSLWKKNRPVIEPTTAIPSFLSGILAGCAITLLCISQQYLSQAIAFPLCIMLPGCVASLWSVIYFKEIRGLRNMAILLIAYVFTFAGAILIALSK